LLLAAVVGACVVLAAGAIGLDVMHRAGAMVPASTSAAALLNAPSGTTYKAVLRIGQPAAGGFAVEVLEGSGTQFRATGVTARLQLDTNVTMVMGTVDDIKPGAIVQASGTVTAGHALHARQIVVLTGYVQVVG
jgi:hypothetical protein